MAPFRQDGAEEVEVYHLAEGVDVQVEERFVRRDGGSGHVAACGVQQDVDGAETFYDGFLVLFQYFLVQYVGREEQGFCLLVQLSFQLLA